MAWRAGLSRRVTAAAACALIVTAAVLAIALAATAGVRAAGRELSQRLVPAAATAGSLLKAYQAQQGSLRDYVTSGQVSQLATLRNAGRGIPAQQARLATLLRGYPHMPAELAAAEAAQRVWLARIAAPQLAAMARGDLARARALQANIPVTRPFTVAVRNRVAALQAMITAQQAMVTGRLLDSQGQLISALVGMCVLVAAITAGAVLVVRRWLLRPFTALRRATEDVAAGNYDNPIPAQGPLEFADLARSTEHMRTRLVSALAERERAEQGFRRLFEAAPDATLAIAMDQTVAIANAQAEALFGYQRGDLAGRKIEALVPAVAITIEAAHRADYFADPEPRPMGADMELPAVRSDGTEFRAEISLSGLSADGQPLVIVTIRDISERLAVQGERERLRAEAERQRTQGRLQQAQKLESLGQLVGGVAHDFNNLIHIITGYTNLTGDQLTALAQQDPRLKPVLSDISQIRGAAEQAARLTRQLLTFARHDLVKPEVFSLNDIVEGAGQILHRTLGEHIDLEILSNPELWLVKADRGQLEQVLVNLAINARDAMPRGGKLSIETDNLQTDAAYAEARPGLRPGRYVRLRVSDTGTGMDQATIDRAFEPFFTTKPKGHGSGLGLSTVHGVVTQAGGTVQIYSEPGLGTTFTVLIPASHETATLAGRVPAPATEDQRGNGEIILLVEDEESLRQLGHRILTGHGYHVHPARTGPAAVQYAADPAHRLDLLLTDLVMPEMLGTDVAERILEHRPGLPVLYMSGYAQPILASHGADGPEMNILEKPFTEVTLLTRVHEVLRQAQHAAGLRPAARRRPGCSGGGGPAQGTAERQRERGGRHRGRGPEAPRLARADAVLHHLGVQRLAEAHHRGQCGQRGSQCFRGPGRERGAGGAVLPPLPQREIRGQGDESEQPCRGRLQQEVAGMVGEHGGHAGMRAGVPGEPAGAIRPGVGARRPGRGQELVALHREQQPGGQPGPADRQEACPADQGGGEREPANQRQRWAGQCGPAAGDPVHRAHPRDRLRLCLRLCQPSGDPLSDRVAQVRLHLSQGVPHLARAAAQRDEQPVEVVLDGVSRCVRDVPAHAVTPGRAGRHGEAATGVPSTRATEPLNSLHCCDCSASAASPAAVSR
jgi:PAS domain S-box-containing protein